jgi:tRNA G10  N-methylase Trm11
MAKITDKISIDYFFIWGSHPAISLVEVLSAFTRWGISYKLIHSSVEASILHINEFLPEEFINQLGGTIKIGQILNIKNGKTISAESIAKFLTANSQEEKIFFGISQYRLDNFTRPLNKKNIDTLAKNVKALLKKTHRIRWVTSKDKNLSAVTVKKNKLIGTGAEIVLLCEKKKTWVGKTIAVQPFEEYSARDYGREVTDLKVGMIPPKLAQMLLNISGARTQDVILDPFCGYGTILQEALLMGWHQVVGSDIAKTSVDGTKKNLLWLKKEFKLSSCIIRIFHSDARAISEHVREGYVNAIITEPHLGPALRKRLTKENALAIKNELEALYFLAFLDFAKFLRPGNRVVMVWPVFILSSMKDGLLYVDLLKKLQNIGFVQAMPFKKELHMFEMGGESTRDTLIYGRPNQRVWREIISFTFIPKS